MFIKLLSSVILFLTIGFTSTFSFADEAVTGRKIIDIGCHYVDDTCFVALSGPTFGAEEKCNVINTNEFRFSSSTVNGKRTYASLLSAFLAKKTVDIVVRGCDIKTGAVTLAWFHIR